LRGFAGRRSGIARVLIGAVCALGILNAGPIYPVYPIEDTPAGWSQTYPALSVVYDLNNLGQVAGYGWNGRATQAFIGPASGSTPVPLPAGWSVAYGWGINDSGQVAGYGWNGRATQAFIGPASGSTPVPLPTGWSAACGQGINNSGQVAGDTFHGSPELAFIGTTSGITPIPTIPGRSSIRVPLFPLNNAGQVIGVGYGFFTGGGWIWDPVNGVRDLNDLAPAEWSVGEPMSINDRGQILAWGSNWQTLYSGPVLLDPTVPEPTTSLLLGGGLILLWAFARRKCRN